ncbi:MAG: hypothetical protein KME05_14325 [Gloeocapsa sp. UFS-A4-WI-NPMV-4B04]|jgi:hypothetical protein|nr:hypothetical protein [Gloeocapsa sp. UFS-A4-WI-NPMV-4B04]
MKPYLFLTSCLLSAGLVNLPPIPVQADSPVQKVLSSDAQGLNNKLSTITVWAGAGANLNFIPTGEIVKKVWLDDPSQIVLDFDGPMCMQAGDRGQSDHCSNSAATIVHLKRIHSVKFPNLPQTDSTLLSVVTQTSAGERKLYQFQITYGTGAPQYHTVAIYPDAQTPTDGMNGLVQAQLQNVELGLRVAKSRNLLGRNQGNQRLELRVQNFLDLVSSGATPQSASQQAGVSMRLISKLASLGTASTAQQQAQLPARNQQIENPPTNPPSDSQRKRWSQSEPPQASPDRATQRSPNPVASPPVTELQQPKVPMNQLIGANASRPKQPSVSTIPPGARPQQQKTTTSVLSSASRTPRNLNTANPSPVVKKPLLTQTSSRLPSRVIPQRRLITATATRDKSSAQAPKSQQAIDDANATAFGLVVAKQKGQIAPNTTTWKKAQGAIRQLRLGKNREEAARRSGIDMATLSQLIKWGQNRP